MHFVSFKDLHILILIFYFCGVSNAFQENSKFCIRTEPMLLIDIEKHVNPLEGDPHCEILATTLTVKEKESFIKTMCKDLVNASKDDYNFLKLRNGDLNGRGSYQEICSGKTNPLLAWVPYEMILSNYAQELNPKERLNYIGKATNVELERTELCHFRHSDLVTNISSELFTCVVMIFEDNFYGLESHINVLVEIQPIMYEVSNITYLPWVNVTTGYKTLLSKTIMRNPSYDKKEIYGSINYAYVEKVHLNTSTIYGQHLEKLPLLFEHRNAVLELNEQGIGGVDVKEKAFFARLMDAKATVNVDVVGEWAERRQQFTAEIYEYFGYGIKRFRHEMHGGIMTVIRIETTEPVYEIPDSSLLTNDTAQRKQSERISDSNDNAEWSELDDFTELPEEGHPYPEFLPWFLLGVLVVCAAFLTGIIGVIRTCKKEDQERKLYQLAKPYSK